MAIHRLGALAALPLHQIVILSIRQSTPFDILGFLVVRPRHGARIGVARTPTARRHADFHVLALGILDHHLAVFQHHGKLDRIVLVHFLGAALGLFPAETQVEVGAIVGRLHAHRDAAGMIGKRLGLELHPFQYLVGVNSGFFHPHGSRCRSRLSTSPWRRRARSPS